ncbi:hypothetical protein PTTG_25420 [Puccinia triticina 1-1 BBBD Race 1]|uniref:Dimer_Tnp_hAT domain-containing protein n=1 Tax=Puccinia triticina (isolate 1-1 / race 1 (BBBD)) TaxID=630390 RepID=A0A180H2E8_PUCT1|nr:hypothetical protein PTTG_25420 [Puccinia triticina 1-1 BBBD Race 1]
MRKSYDKLRRLRETARAQAMNRTRTPALQSIQQARQAHDAYPCKLCGIKINPPTGDSSCSNLNKHASICLCKHKDAKSTQSLASLGITGTGDIQPKEVPQLCAIWCAESARPFSALVDASHKAILHPTVVKYLPRPRNISNNIHLLYSAIQDNYCSVLKEHQGVLYIGVDAWQSPNGFDILGMKYDLKLEAMRLDFVRLSHSHTGEYLANTVCVIVEKFGVQDKICGLFSNNAKNNEVMVREIKKFKWPRFRGKPQWICCFAHILNLIAQAILRPFGNKDKEQNSNKRTSNNANHDSDESEFEDDDAEEQIRHLPRGESDISTHLTDEESKDELFHDQEDDNGNSLSEADIEQASEEDEGDTYTTNRCKLTLAKFRAIAKKLRFSPNSRAEFFVICQKHEFQTPHSVERDVRTQWNSLFAQIKSIIHCNAAILEWQRHKQHGIDCKYLLDKSDIDLACDLAHVLSIFQELTLQVSTAGLSCLLNIVVYIDQITKHLSTVISDLKYPPALRNACRYGLKLTNKYYSLTDTSPLYRIAILLHPSFKDEYFKLANWEPNWIAEAICLAWEMWISFYKPQPPLIPLIPSASSSKASQLFLPKTSMLAGLGNTAAARGGNGSTDAFDIWLAGGLILDGSKPVNPLNWWMKQKRAGNMHGGLVDMALDVLSCPATSVDVKRAFSFS